MKKSTQFISRESYVSPWTKCARIISKHVLCGSGDLEGTTNEPFIEDPDAPIF